MTISAGMRLGPYEILAQIGAGGMGEVYSARDTRLGRDVAIKVMPAALARDAERIRRFDQEARAAGLLNHPNILAIYDVGTHADSPYVVAELLQGRSLREELQEGGAMSVRKAVDSGVQIARGLTAAHEKGIIHRDLKPENLFLTTDGRVKILDFGLAKLTDRLPERGQGTEAPTLTVKTTPGVVLGTIGYMSPEQVRGRPADQRSDLFSFGAVLHEMLTGTRAFQGESAVEAMNAILKEDPRVPLSSNPGIPPALERIVQRCLEKNAASRFQTASDLGFALESLLGASGQSAAAVAPISAPQKRYLVWTLAAVLLLAAIAGGVSPADARQWSHSRSIANLRSSAE